MQNLWNDIAVRVVHPRTGYTLQEEHIIRLMQEQHIPFEFQLKGDKEDLTNELLANYFTSNLPFSKGSLSCSIKHLLIYEEFLGSDKNYLLVFEDDIFLAPNFYAALQEIVNEVKKRQLTQILISLENSCMRFPSYWQTKAGRLLYKAKDGRAAGAYLVDKAAVQAMVSELRKNKCATVIDWWHNYLAKEQIISIFWAHPTIAEQGSHNGKLSADISTHQSSWRRQISWHLHKFIRTYIKRLFNESRVLPS